MRGRARTGHDSGIAISGRTRLTCATSPASCALGVGLPLPGMSAKQKVLSRSPVLSRKQAVRHRTGRLHRARVCPRRTTVLIRCFARQRGTTHHALAHRTSSDESIHPQNGNPMYSALKRFMRLFNGVAARYLDNYTTFFKYNGADVREALYTRLGNITGRGLTDMKLVLI